MNRQMLLKISAILSFTFITLALILIKLNSPATGYELSLYASLPPATWVFLIGAMILGIGIIVNEAFGEKEDNSWYLGFVALLMCNLIVLSLHIIRGYYFITISDSLAHMALISEIVQSGSIGDNIYPITHILGANLCEISSMDERFVVKILPIIFSLMSMIFIYLLASEVAIKRSHSLLAAAAGTTLTYSYYHISTYPQTLALFTFPLFFYLYFKSSVKVSVSFTILFIILLILLPFFHPFMEILLICCLASSEIVRVLWKKKASQTTSQKTFNKISSSPFFISLIVYLTWEWNFSTFSQLGNKFLDYFSSEVKETPRAQEVQYISQKEPKDMTLVVAKLYGDQFIYFFLAGIALMIILWYYFKKNEKYDNLFLLSTFCCVSGPVYLLLFMSLGVTTIGRLVGSNASLWVIPILAGFSLYELFKKLSSSRRSIAVVIVTFVLVSSTVLGVFTVYRSPWINQPNMQITEMDMKGLGWTGISIPQEKNIGYLGWTAGFHAVEFPPHFGSQNTTIGENLKQNLTVILTERFRLAVANPVLSTNSVAPAGLSAEGFNSNDLKRFEQDTSVCRLYTNGEFDVLQVKTKGESNESSVDN